MHVNPRIAALLEALNNPTLPGIDLSLVRMAKLLEALEHPERKLPPVIHFAGTNGKGSTLAFLRAMYEAAGYRVHAYTSPHLVRFNERMVIAGAQISDAYLEQLLVRVRAAAQEIPVTFFEATTAVAFLAFAEHSADVVLLETGLGGRLDATNMVEKPIACVITPVDDDHREFLGETLGEIATEKAGIIKQGVVCFAGVQKAEAREVLKRVARQKKAPLVLHGREWSHEATADGFAVLSGTQRWLLPPPSLVGVHQYHNAALASVVARSLPQLPVGDVALTKAVASAVWPARLQRLSQGPLVDAWGARGAVMLDGGHNVSAAEILAAWVDSQGTPVTLMLGMMRRKDAAGFLAPFKGKLARVMAVMIEGHESYRAEELADFAREAGFPVVQSGCAPLAVDDAAGTLLIAGSLFLAGELLKNHS